ncbi:Asp-tRNA(Asn)/Glu-tRNA(Gln) amidotransferase GatCAB subunit C [Paracoccus suum]|uniref:Asp-tRNA(Asn)/Glu-tRNA(Gln) amidotransferase GatCAB subunit C n=2 Tax=Paracoccus suum TaxID=2259340 RepID=A0A344PMP2_9RHOB|nr:Asp-tRNA(Asn)/Glu-tRNA(Gln) amidotransferase GatCAB subunit C [Paracoccus suum]
MRDGRPTGLIPFERDPAPSPIGLDLMADRLSPARITRPHISRAYLQKRQGSIRGAEPFVPVDWDTALDLVAEEITAVRAEFGNGAIFGGSYGWSSAGRFHHAQSQVHRFLNCAGGYVRSVQNYSFAAGDVVVPHVVGTTRGLVTGHTPWTLLAGSTELMVMFGGIPLRNTQVNAGGVGRHAAPEGLLECRRAGASFVNISPIRDDAAEELGAEWLALRPNTDVALMLGIAEVLIAEGRYDSDFLDRYTVGFERFKAYVTGAEDGVRKDPEWAAAITQIPAARIRALALEMSQKRTFIAMNWALQRAQYGEQPYWMAITLAAMLGGIGQPGGGFGFGYGSAGGIGNVPGPIKWPSLPQGTNPVRAFIPVARIADMLLNPGGTVEYDGQALTYPDIRLIYWAGGNPFHHHQDLNRLRRAWQRPRTVVVQESWWTATARHADIVLPATTFFERNDLACSSRDNFVSASHKLFDAPGEALDDYEILGRLSARLGFEDAFTEGRSEGDWLRWLYRIIEEGAAAIGQPLPPFDEFWASGYAELTPTVASEAYLERFRTDPVANRLGTPSGLIEIGSEAVRSFGYDDCPGRPNWRPPLEWLGAPLAAQYPLHLMSNQPARRLHSQWDHARYSRESKPGGREPVRMHPDDAAARGIAQGDVVRVFNGRGSLLASADLSDALRPQVVQMATGAWFDPSDPQEIGGLERHGNPNVLTPDIGTSRLAQGPSPNSCLVQIEKFVGPVPPVRAFEPPQVVSISEREGRAR